MEVVNEVAEMQKISENHRQNGDIIVCVPTMGYFHEGHLNLMRLARNYGNIVIVTLFVNPTQFGPNEDFERYPRNFQRDKELAQSVKVDYLFAPSVEEMYPDGYSTMVKPTKFIDKFEGIKRPGHFDGVATVVSKLFNATKPHFAIFGQKDLQQTLVVKQLVKDLLFDINIIVAPTIRESNGLALSSRNTYLSESEKEKASIIFRAIQKGISKINDGETKRKVINESVYQYLLSVPEIRVEYACAVVSDTLDEPEEFTSGQQVAILVAVYLGKTRLIDNAITTVP
jgi:pantoate--beta-alanine ligase